MADPILDLTTLVTRPRVDIDGEAYEMLSPGELSIIENHRFALWGQQLQQLVADENKGDELTKLVDQLAHKVLVGVPDEVYQKLHGIQRFEVVEAFTVLLLRRKASVVGAIGKMIADPTTGETSSPASSASTAEIQNGGSSKLPSQS